MSIPTNIESINVEDIGYSIDNLKLLKGIQFNLNSNRINTLIGPNGSGKTLTNRILGLLLSPSTGTIAWNDHIIPTEKSLDDLVDYRRKIGYVSQKPSFLNRLVEQNCELPLILSGMEREVRKKKVEEKLEKFELLDIRNRYPGKLSLGQQQKLSLLIAMIKDPPLLILDEPTASLDPHNTNWFETFIKSNYISEEKIILWTTHDIHQMERISDNVIFIINGQILETGDKSILKNPINQKVVHYLNGELILD